MPSESETVPTWRRYAGAQVFVFDKGGSARAAVLGLGGTALDLGSEGVPAFQPLARIDTSQGLSAALDWVMGLIVQEGVLETPDLKQRIWTALQSLSSAPIEQRHLTALRDGSDHVAAKGGGAGPASPL